MTQVRTEVLIAGGGPAGMVLGLLLARGGLQVVVLERHHDFLRDFRGDTIHPTTLDLLRDLGLQDRLEPIPHTEVRTLDAVLGGVRFPAADFRHVGRSGRLWFMPQWDLLDVLAEAASGRPGFDLRMDTAATGLIREGDRATGVHARGPEGDLEIRADLVVAADGRDSRLREAAGLRLVERAAPVDVLWFRVDRPASDPPDTIAYLADDVVITIPRTDYYQCALLIPSGGADAVRAAGLPAFRERVGAAAPFLRPVLDRIEDWDAVHPLHVRIARAPRWHRPGLMLIGDAAHPMSPAFGVGINLAVQDAVATARVLLRRGHDVLGDPLLLDRVRRRRLPPVRAMQAVQGAVHRTVGRPNPISASPALRRAAGVALPVTAPVIRPLLGRLVGAGFRPERLDF